MKTLERVISIVGSQDKLGRLIGVSQGRISQWLNGAPIHPRHFAAIVEAAAHEEVTPEALLADEMSKLAGDGIQRQPGVPEFAALGNNT